MAQFKQEHAKRAARIQPVHIFTLERSKKPRRERAARIDALQERRIF